MLKYVGSRQLPVFVLTLVLALLPLLAQPVVAKTRAKASSKTKQSAKASAKKTTSRSTRSSRSSAARSTRSKKASAPTAKFNAKEMQALARKRGKLTKDERKKLASFRAAQAAAERRRRQAIIEARLRAIRARDSALRNIASENVLKDNTTGEDLEIRRAAIEALAGKAGTVVVMDPNNGRIFTVVNQQMAIGSPVKPCSTVKLVVGLAGLNQNAFDPNSDVAITARYSMNLTDALARSDNPFFQVVGRMMGYDQVLAYAQNYGFGQMTGVNYPGESPGFLPEPDEENGGRMYSHGDGFGFTAIQLAAFTSAIANGGDLYIPRVPRTTGEAEQFRAQLKRRIQMTTEDRMRMMAGMSGAVNYGTAKLAADPFNQVAGKTGTCTGETDKLGLFTSFSNPDNPRLVVTVITTGSGEAGKKAAEIAGRVYRSISYRFFRQQQPPMYPAASTSGEFPRIGASGQNK